MSNEDGAPTAGAEIVSASPPAPGRHDALIDTLFAAHFHGAPAMRDTDAFNHALAFRDLLKQRLAKETDQ